MGLFSRRVKVEPQEARQVTLDGPWPSEAMSAVGVERAMRLTPLYAAVRLIADQGASLPLKAYRESAGVATAMPAPELLRKPSSRVSLFAWKQQALTSLLLRGNAFGYITGFSGTAAKSIEWLHPDQVSVDESSSLPIYRLNGVMLDSSRVVHIPGLSVPGSVVGLSPLTQFRLTIETGLEAQQFSRDWFTNGGPVAPGSHLRHTGRDLEESQAADVKARYKASVRAGDVFVTGKSWELSQLTVKADDAAFVATARLTATQIAAAYGVPPEMVGGETGSSLTYSTVEMNSLNFVTYTLRPWLARIEEAVSSVMPSPQFARFNVDALLRADTKTRYETHAIGIASGFLEINEARELEDRPPLPPKEGPNE